MSFIPDLLQREQALNPNLSFIIQAPAGSGKTELLIQRFLVLLALVKQPEEVLAITFTRKAAAEMTNRVMQALQRAVTEPEPNTEPARKTWHLAQAVLQRDHEKKWQLLTSPHRLRIQTIDAFCASLTRQMPVLSQFGAQPEVTDNADFLYWEAVRNFMSTLETDEPWTDALAQLLLHLDNQHHQIEKLLVAMLATRDQWLPHINEISHIENSRERLEAGLVALIEEKLQALAIKLTSAQAGALFELVRYACIQLQKLQPEANLLCCHKLKGLPDYKSTYLREWQAIASFLLTQKLEWRKSVTVKDGFPATDKTCSKQENDLRKEMKEKFKSLIDELAENEELCQALRIVLQLPPPKFSDDQWQTLTALLTVLKIVAGFLWLTFQEYNTVDYIEIAQRALMALGATDEPTNLALSLDYKIQHILVDEFQDTSSIQFRLLEKLTHGWEPRDGRTLFLVGDPMQSIYRFRKAEVGLFIQAEQYGINQIKLEKLTLTTNFRSQTQLVDWFNCTFSRIFPAQTNISLGAIPYTLALGILAANPIQTNFARPHVQVHAFLNDNMAEIEQIVELVQSYLQFNPKTSIAILVRARSHLNDLIPALQQAKIAYRAVEIEALREKPAIHDLFALTRALLFLDDRIAWLALLRAPWCGLNNSDLYAIAAGDHKAPIWERLHQLEQLPLSAEGLSRVKQFINLLTPYIEHRCRKSLSAWLESIWLQLGGPASIKSTNELEDTQNYFKLVAQLQRGEDNLNINLLEEKLAELYATPATGDDIKVELMTIHKAKGLEFDVVILPCLDKEGAADRSQLMLINERPAANNGLGLIIAPIKAFAETQDAISEFIKNEEKQKAELELTRLLYVAVTRAKHYLHLLGQVSYDSKQNELKPPARDSLLGKLWPQIASEVLQQLPNNKESVQEKSKSTNPKTQLIRLNAGWQPLSLAMFKEQQTAAATHESIHSFYQIRQTTLKHTGTLIHRLFCQLSHTSIEQRSTFLKQEIHWRTSLLNLGVAVAELNFAIQTIASALQQALTDEKALWILDKNHLQAYSEYPLSYREGNTIKQVILDRTFIDANGIRWIIDYKTTLYKENSIEQEYLKHHTQLELYAKIMRQLEHKPIRLGLYFPLLPSWYEWEYEG